MKTGKVETMDMFGDYTLTQMRKETMEAAAQKDGCECRVCGQFVKVYRRTITSTMARQLITAWHKHKDGWFHTRDVVLVDASGAGDFSKLEYFGLIERQAHIQGDDGKKSSGMWRITAGGEAFIKGNAMVQMYVLIYNNNILGREGELISIRHALGNKYDYREIMGWTGHAGSLAAMSMAAGQ